MEPNEIPNIQKPKISTNKIVLISSVIVFLILIIIILSKTQKSPSPKIYSNNQSEVGENQTGENIEQNTNQETEENNTVVTNNTSNSSSGSALIGSGENKLPKFSRLFDTSKPITMKVSDLSGTLLLTVVDVFNSYTNLDELVGPGSYNIYFYDGATGALLEPAGDQEMHVIDIK